MAAQNQVIVNLTANAKGFVAGTSQAQRALQNFNQGILASTQGVTRFRGANGQFITTAQAAKQVVAQLTAEKQEMLAIENQLSKVLSESEMAILRSSGAFSGLSAGAGSASFALLSLGQAFQDSAQFGMGFAQGFRAINNNIQQTFTAIAFGSVQMGGFNNLIKAMRGSLLGPGGLILGFSALSAGIEFFATRAQRAAKDAEDIANTFEEAANSVIKFNSAVQGLSIQIPEEALPQLAETLRTEVEALDVAFKTIAEGEEPSRTWLNLGSAARDLIEANLELQEHQLGLSEDITGLEAKREARQERIRLAQEVIGSTTEGELEGKRAFLKLLDAELAFVGERNRAIEIAKNLGLDFESTSKRTLTTIEKLTNQYNDLVKAFAGTGEAERQEGSLRARIAILKDLRGITIEYSQSIEEMRLLMNQEGQEVIGETSRLEQLNEKLRERIRLRRQILGLEDIGSDQLRQLSNGTKDFAEEYERSNAARIKADAEGAKSFLNLQEGISKGIGLVSRSFGSMGTTFMQLAQQQEDGSKRMFKIGKALAISQAIMNSYQAYTAALADQTMPGPLRFISAGAALAAGLAQVAAIKSTKFGGGGGGGASSGRSGISSAPTFFTSFGSTADFPASSVGSLSAAGTSGTNISLVVQGRNLVGVIENEVQASSRRIGYSTGVFSGALASSSSTRDVFGGIKYGI